jgi:hypothetical protein
MLLTDQVQWNPVKTFLKVPRKPDFLSGKFPKRVGPKSSIFLFFVNLLHMYAEFVQFAAVLTHSDLYLTI